MNSQDLIEQWLKDIDKNLIKTPIFINQNLRV